MKKLLPLLLILLLPAIAFGQGYDKRRGRVQKQDEESGKVRLQLTTCPDELTPTQPVPTRSAESRD